MPAATDKSDLLTIFDRDLANLFKTLDGVDEAKAALSAPDDDTTIKGVIAHRTHWIGMFFGWYEDGVADREVHVPAKGFPTLRPLAKSCAGLLKYNKMTRSTPAARTRGPASGRLAGSQRRRVHHISAPRIPTSERHCEAPSEASLVGRRPQLSADGSRHRPAIRF